MSSLLEQLSKEIDQNELFSLVIFDFIVFFLNILGRRVCKRFQGLWKSFGCL